jgi:Transposase IS200 like
VVRFARVVALDVAHHITQRGNARRFILETDAERGVYLDLLQQGIQRHGVELIGYCLMSNHIHLVAVPQNKDAGAQLETNTWPIRLLLERSQPFQRACMAGALLFLPSRRDAPLGSPSLYRTQPGASLHRGICAGLALVFRSGPLQYCIGGPVVEHGCLGATMVQRRLARLSTGHPV